MNNIKIEIKFNDLVSDKIEFSPKYKKRLDKLCLLEKGWYDNEEGEKPTDIAMTRCAKLLTFVLHDEFGIFPTIEGGLYIEQDVKNDYVNYNMSVEIFPDGMSQFHYIEFDTNNQITLEGNDDILRNWFVFQDMIIRRMYDT